MNGLQRSEVDFVKELRLRRWARENYVPAESRRDSWHPVVLEEMQAKDAEAANRRPLSSPYVPLAPSASLNIHRGHSEHAEPNMLRQPQESEVYYLG